jgi:tRNA (cytidine/uridine-2'-O-)-methyltransferase
MFNVVLVYPDIPYNTGNIGRICVGLNANLHLVKPLGFKLDDRYLKRAGLDYWKYVNLKIYDSYEEFAEKKIQQRKFFASTKGKINYYDLNYKRGDFFVFGSETAGLPDEIIQNNIDNCITIPMPGQVRSLNLSNAVSVVIYEAYRQVTTE